GAASHSAIFASALAASSSRIIALTGPCARALIALGYRSLSLSATAHGPVKAMILELDAAKAEAKMAEWLAAPAGSLSMRQKLTEFAESEGLAL
ncbi:MAG: hypothetical protein ACK5CS_36205, partial [Bradyrhizobium sp.]